MLEAERKVRADLAHLGFDPGPDARLEELLRMKKGAIDHLMWQGGGR
ncbi:MAG TPA: hypothetical protein VK988_20565 [Acidimicrobiales bacterium]|nr:hypothetical protein [Acidimicrobiales bacterium]